MERLKLKMERIKSYERVNLFVKNLDSVIDAGRLIKEFQPYGNITSAKVIGDSQGASKGFGFVCFSSPKEAKKAITEMNGQIIVNKPLYVAHAWPKEASRKAQLASQYAKKLTSMRMHSQQREKMFQRGADDEYGEGDVWDSYGEYDEGDVRGAYGEYGEGDVRGAYGEYGEGDEWDADEEYGEGDVWSAYGEYDEGDEWDANDND